MINLHKAGNELVTSGSAVKLATDWATGPDEIPQSVLQGKKSTYEAISTQTFRYCLQTTPWDISFMQQKHVFDRKRTDYNLEGIYFYAYLAIFRKTEYSKENFYSLGLWIYEILLYVKTYG